MQSTSTKTTFKEQEEETQMEFEQSETPQKCQTGCGHYGNPKTRNLCSFCFQIVLKEETYSQPTILAVAANVPDKIPSNDHDDSVTIKKKNRCQACNKRVGLLGFGCRCGRTFCGLHRMPEEHACEFDFKAAGRAVLEEQNPVCVADKMQTRI